MVDVQVEFEYIAQEEDELTLHVGDVITNVNKVDGGWWEGELNGKKGVFPDNFVKEIKKDGKKEQKGHVANMAHNLIKTGGIKMGQPPPGPVVHRNQDAQKKKTRAKVTFSYTPEHEDELRLEVGETVEIVKQAEEGWWEGLLNGKTGVFPSNFVELLDENGELPAKEKEVDGAVKEIPGKKIRGVGLGNIFSDGPIKLRPTAAQKDTKDKSKEEEAPKESQRRSIARGAPPPVPREAPVAVKEKPDGEEFILRPCATGVKDSLLPEEVMPQIVGQLPKQGSEDRDTCFTNKQTSDDVVITAVGLDFESLSQGDVGHTNKAEGPCLASGPVLSGLPQGEGDYVVDVQYKEKLDSETYAIPSDGSGDVPMFINNLSHVQQTPPPKMSFRRKRSMGTPRTGSSPGPLGHSTPNDTLHNREDVSDGEVVDYPYARRSLDEQLRDHDKVIDGNKQVVHARRVTLATADDVISRMTSGSDSNGSFSPPSPKVKHKIIEKLSLINGEKLPDSNKLSRRRLSPEHLTVHEQITGCNVAVQTKDVDSSISTVGSESNSVGREGAEPKKENVQTTKENDESALKIQPEILRVFTASPATPQDTSCMQRVKHFPKAFRLHWPWKLGKTKKEQSKVAPLTEGPEIMPVAKTNASLFEKGTKTVTIKEETETMPLTEKKDIAPMADEEDLDDDILEEEDKNLGSVKKDQASYMYESQDSVDDLSSESLDEGFEGRTTLSSPNKDVVGTDSLVVVHSMSTIQPGPQVSYFQYLRETGRLSPVMKRIMDQYRVKIEEWESQNSSLFQSTFQRVLYEEHMETNPDVKLEDYCCTVASEKENIKPTDQAFTPAPGKENIEPKDEDFTQAIEIDQTCVSTSDRDLCLNSREPEAVTFDKDQIVQETDLHQRRRFWERLHFRTNLLNKLMAKMRPRKKKPEIGDQISLSDSDEEKIIQELTGKGTAGETVQSPSLHDSVSDKDESLMYEPYVKACRKEPRDTEPNSDIPDPLMNEASDLKLLETEMKFIYHETPTVEYFTPTIAEVENDICVIEVLPDFPNQTAPDADVPPLPDYLLQRSPQSLYDAIDEEADVLARADQPIDDRATFDCIIQPEALTSPNLSDDNDAKNFQQWLDDNIGSFESPSFSELSSGFEQPWKLQDLARKVLGGLTLHLDVKVSAEDLTKSTSEEDKQFTVDNTEGEVETTACPALDSDVTHEDMSAMSDVTSGSIAPKSSPAEVRDGLSSPLNLSAVDHDQVHLFSYSMTGEGDSLYISQQMENQGSLNNFPAQYTLPGAVGTSTDEIFEQTNLPAERETETVPSDQDDLFHFSIPHQTQVVITLPIESLPLTSTEQTEIPPTVNVYSPSDELIECRIPSPVLSSKHPQICEGVVSSETMNSIFPDASGAVGSSSDSKIFKRTDKEELGIFKERLSLDGERSSSYTHHDWHKDKMAGDHTDFWLDEMERSPETVSGKDGKTRHSAYFQFTPVTETVTYEDEVTASVSNASLRSGGPKYESEAEWFTPDSGDFLRSKVPWHLQSREAEELYRTPLVTTASYEYNRYKKERCPGFFPIDIRPVSVDNQVKAGQKSHAYEEEPDDEEEMISFNSTNLSQLLADTSANAMDYYSFTQVGSAGSSGLSPSPHQYNDIV